MKTLIDGETFCRTCLCTTAEFHSLFAENLMEILKQCTSVDVDEHETIAMICRECHSLLLNFWQFRLNSLEADAVVKSALRIKSEMTDIELKSEAQQQSNYEYESEIAAKIEPIDDQTDANTEPDYPSPDASIAYRPLHDLVRICADMPKLEEPSNGEDKKPEIQLKRRQKTRGPNRNLTSVVISCKICNKIVKTRRLLYRHNVSVHTAEVPVFCDKCNKTFKTETSLKRHMDICHYGIKPIPRNTGNICGLRFMNFEQHVANMHKNPKNSIRNNFRKRRVDSDDTICKICKKITPSRWKLRQHLVSVHTVEIPLSCNKCMRTFKTEAYLQRHMDTYHNGITSIPRKMCNICGLRFINFEKHVANMHKNPKKSIRNNFLNCKVETSDDTTCKICNKIAKNLKELRQHLASIHTVEIPLPCDKCIRTFKTEAKLKRHMDISHSGIKSTPREMCNICGLQFKNIEQHVTKMHENAQQRSFSCRFCRTLFADMSSLIQHSKTEHERDRDAEEHNYECTVCGKKFRSGASLYHHLKSQHSDKRPFPCSVCNKQFKKRQTLTSHMRFHTDERPYACDLCDKKFRQTSTLKNHRRVHTGEKPYVCNECQKAFTQLITMKTHMKVHYK